MENENMSTGILDGKKGIIFGPLSERSIAYQLAKEVRKAGADIILADAPEEINETHGIFASELNTKIYPADGKSVDSIQHLLDYTLDHFSRRFDFIFYDDNDDSTLSSTYKNGLEDEVQASDSVLSFNKLLQSIYSNNAIMDGGSIVCMKRNQSVKDIIQRKENSNCVIENAVTQSICYLFWNRKHVRVNTISSPVIITSWSAQNCVDMAVMLFSNYTKNLTMQELNYAGNSTSEKSIRLLIHKTLK